jgi:hypothetical protein
MSHLPSSIKVSECFFILSIKFDLKIVHKLDFKNYSGKTIKLKLDSIIIMRYSIEISSSEEE